MADAFADAFKRYWAVITTVAAMMLSLGGAIYTVTSKIEADIASIHAQLADMRADLREVKVRQEFQSQRRPQ